MPDTIITEQTGNGKKVAEPGSVFPSDKLRFATKRLKVTLVATFEIASNEDCEEVETQIGEATEALGVHGKVTANYEVL